MVSVPVTIMAIYIPVFIFTGMLIHDDPTAGDLFIFDGLTVIALVAGALLAFAAASAVRSVSFLGSSIDVNPVHTFLFAVMVVLVAAMRPLFTFDIPGIPTFVRLLLVAPLVFAMIWSFIELIGGNGD